MGRELDSQLSNFKHIPVDQTSQADPPPLPHELLYKPGPITGHGRLPDYLHRFHKTNHQKCKCGGQANNIDHYLTTCPLTNAKRHPLEDKFPKDIWPTNQKF
ncbi:hypothetical protein HPB48_012891 [Haemaphysalis longicornis]|uniref:Uncharacterized protein n=1 Tax=Haemaphysalis longicornis TaxID=44386 RepID=A0A9J6GIB9_HAELO|nr:hypothetical protein HPB48_012891 [Haemaphysalis longicornis]